LSLAAGGRAGPRRQPPAGRAELSRPVFRHDPYGCSPNIRSCG
jgi:hypothetical protein